MKKIVLPIILLALSAITTMAQDKLMRISAEDREIRNQEPKLAFHDKEITRLLIPENAEFGMIVVPSFYSERALAYDSVSHMLVTSYVKKSIWNEMTKPFKQNNMSLYKAPDVRKRAVSLNYIQTRKLKTLWNHVISTSEDRLDNKLDGTSWTFFLGDQQAKARHSNNPMVRFVEEICSAVSDSDTYRLEFLIDFALDKTIERMDRLPALDDPVLSQRCRVVDTLVVWNGEVLPSKLYRQGKPPTEYFYQRQQIIVGGNHSYRNALMQRDYAEDYSIIARDHIYEIITVPDTLCEAYLQQHPDKKKNLRRIEGFVKDEKGKAVAHAWTNISGWCGGAPTDEQGHFVFWTPLKDNRLDVYCDGYSPALKYEFDTVPVTIRIKPSPFKF